MGSKRVDEAKRKADEHFGQAGLDRLSQMCDSKAARTRLEALALMQKQIYEGVETITYLPLARRLVGDPDSDCRWQAAIVIENLLDSHPHDVWEVVRQHGDSPDPDLQAAVATILLEELLRAHFDEFFPRLRAEVLRGPPRFPEMVRMCWFDGLQGPRYRRVQNLLRNARRGRGSEHE